MSFLLQKDELFPIASQAKAKNQQKISESEKNFWESNLSELSQRIVIGQSDDTTAAEMDDAEVLTNGDGGEAEKAELDEESEAAASQEIAPSKSIMKHDSKLFRLSCPCSDCLQHRETVIQLFLEDFEYNTLWERLQLLIRKFYDLIPEDPQSKMDKKYKELMSKHLTKWLSDGRIDTKKNIQISLGSNLPLSNEMTFILVFSMLYSRDPHQFFELLCIQISSIMKAYCEGLTEIISVDAASTVAAIDYDPSDLLNFIMDGYDKVCSSAEQLAPLLFELQRGHLQKFSLSWALLNKRMYQRCVYFEVLKLIPECILKLKKLVLVEKFKSMVQRFMKFDDEMSTITEQWRDIWNSLLEYHKSTADMARRRRISSAHSIMLAIKQSEFRFDETLNVAEERNVQAWSQLERRDEVWQNVVYHLQKKWFECTNPRLSANICNFRCNKCNKSIGVHYIECQCRTCLIAGGPNPRKTKGATQQVYCAKCSFLESMQNVKKDINEQKAMILNGTFDELKPTAAAAVTTAPTLSKSKKRGFDEVAGIFTALVEKKITELAPKSSVYHLAWAVFKHLTDRVPYSAAAIEPDVFCIFQPNPCTANSCRVATNIIAALYPLNFSKFLLKTYRPLSDDERKKLVTIQNFDFKNLLQKFCDDINKTTENKINADKLHPLHFMDFLLWDSDDSESALLSDVASGFAECYLIDFQFPQKHVIFPYFLKLFRVNGKDIEIDMEWLENISNSKITSFDSEDEDEEGEILITKKLKKCDIKIEDIENKMDQLSLNITKSLEQKQRLTQRTPEKSGASEPVATAAVVTAPTSPVKEQTTSQTITTVATISASGATSVTSTTVTEGTGKATTTTKCNIIEKEIKKPLVEAFKLAASNKKLEAELKSLQKEHSMLKDMITDLEQIHDEMHTHTCTSSNSPSTCSSSTSSTCSSTSDGAKAGPVSKTVGPITNTATLPAASAVKPTGAVASAGSATPSAAGKSASVAQVGDKEQSKVSGDKSSHRTEGQCICYYCTIFGQNDCSHNNRVNETRDRLRKRLHQLQSSKEASAKPISLKKNIKTINKEHPQLVKTTTTTTISTNSTTTTNNAAVAAAAAVAASQKQQQTMAQKRPDQKSQQQPPTPLQQQVRTAKLTPDSTALLHQQMKNLKINSMKITATKSTIGTNTAASINGANGVNTNITTTTTMTGSRKITINKIIQQTQAVKTPIQPGRPAQKSNEPIVARPKKEAAAAAAAAAASQAAENFVIRPKDIQQLSAISAQQAQQLKHLQEVREKLMTTNIQQQQQLIASQAATTTKGQAIRGDAPLEDILKFIEGSDDESTERKESKREQKKAKLKLKREERKKLDQLEELHMRFEVIRQQEAEAQKEVSLLKILNRKKDKQKFLLALENLKRLRDNIFELEEKMDEVQQSIKETNPDFTMRVKKDEDTASTAQQQQQQQLHPQYNNSGGKAGLVNGQPDSLVNKILVDPTKRLVTIRRIELPNSEPQVTVTAKGTSPDKDQLLGTFVNGQLIPPNDPQQQAAKKNNNKKGVVAEPAPKLSEKQIKAAKKEAARQEKLTLAKGKADELKSNAVNAAAQKVEPVKGGKKGAVVDTKTSNKENQPKNKKVNQLTRQDSEDSTSTAQSSSVDEKKSKKKQKKGNAVVEEEPAPVKKPAVKKAEASKVPATKKDTVKVPAKTKKSSDDHEIGSGQASTGTCTPVPSEQSSKVSRKKSVPFIDPEFDNNKFKLLDIDGGSDSEQSDDAMPAGDFDPEPDVVSEVEEEPLPPPPPPPAKLAKKQPEKKVDAKAAKGKPEPPKPTTNQRKNSNETAKKPPPPTLPPPVEVKLTKKEKKLLAKQQKELEEQRAALAAAAKAKSGQNKQGKATGGQQKQATPAGNNNKTGTGPGKANGAKNVASKPMAKLKEKLNIGADTTIELVKSNGGAVNKSQQGNGVSIMDQLSRGIKVEGLTLPPGITLTRVDSQTADAIRAKKESIGRLSQPLQSQNDYHQAPKVDPTMIMAHPMAGLQQNPNGIIMVDTKSINAPPGEGKTANKKNKKKNKNKNAIDPQMVINKNTNLKKRDGQKSGQAQASKKGSTLVQQQKGQEPGMITLRNPMMFNENGAKSAPQLPIGSHRPPGMAASNFDQPAAIIKNENGMFTIRNPALHQALSAAAPGVIGQVPTIPPPIGSSSTSLNQMRQMNPNLYSAGGNFANDNLGGGLGDSYSYFSSSPLDNMTSTTSSYPSDMRRCNSAIGSEVKNAAIQQKQQFYQQQQQQQQQSWNPNPSMAGGSGIPSHLQNGGTDLYGLQQQLGRHSSRCYSPFEQYGGAFSNDFIPNTGFGQPSTNSSPGVIGQPVPNLYSGLGAVGAAGKPSVLNGSNLGGTYNEYSAFANARPTGSSIPPHLHNGNGGGLFDNSTSHHCDDTLSSGRMSLYGSVGSSSPGSVKGGVGGGVDANVGAVGGFSNYEDYSFLQNLQPGQKLNNEVTIHNINESKFIRNQTNQIPDDIEITKVSAPRPSRPYMPLSSTNFDENLMSEKFNQSMSFNGPRLVGAEMKSTSSLREAGDNVFAPNQQVNLNELDLLERDIESFKRFNYYFDPPKNKPKININVKDIKVTGAKKARSQHHPNSSESPSFGDRISDGMSSSFTSSNCDELFTDGDLNGNGGGGVGSTTAGVIGSNDFGIGTSE